MVQGSQKRWDCMGLSQMLGRTWTKRWSEEAFPDSFLKPSFTYLEAGQVGGGGVGRVWLPGLTQLGVWTPDMSYWPGPEPH